MTTTETAKIQDAMEDDGWQSDNRGWWHPPSCLAAWPFDEAMKMWQRDRDRDRKTKNQSEA